VSEWEGEVVGEGLTVGRADAKAKTLERAMRRMRNCMVV
jgi:hypothetical protein